MIDLDAGIRLHPHPLSSAALQQQASQGRPAPVEQPEGN
jgi:hypothetical protein